MSNVFFAMGRENLACASDISTHEHLFFTMGREKTVGASGISSHKQYFPRHG